MALPPGRLPVCGRNSECHTPLVLSGGYRACWLGRQQTSVGAARRRRFAPSAQETNEANRRRIGRRTRPGRGAGEVATSIRGHGISRRPAHARAVIRERGFSPNAGGRPSRAKKVGGHCTPEPGRPAEKQGGAGGKKNAKAVVFPPHRTRKKRLQSAYKSASQPRQDTNFRQKTGPGLYFLQKSAII